MNGFAKADVFFFVTAIAIMVVAVVIVVVGVYMLRILADAKHISKTVRKESDDVAHDIAMVHSLLRRGGKKIGRMFGVRTVVSKQVKKH